MNIDINNDNNDNYKKKYLKYKFKYNNLKLNGDGGALFKSSDTRKMDAYITKIKKNDSENIKYSTKKYAYITIKDYILIYNLDNPNKKCEFIQIDLISTLNPKPGIIWEIKYNDNDKINFQISPKDNQDYNLYLNYFFYNINKQIKKFYYPLINTIVIFNLEFKLSKQLENDLNQSFNDTNNLIIKYENDNIILNSSSSDRISEEINTLTDNEKINQLAQKERDLEQKQKDKENEINEMYKKNLESNKQKAFLFKHENIDGNDLLINENYKDYKQKMIDINAYQNGNQKINLTMEQKDFYFRTSPLSNINIHKLGKYYISYLSPGDIKKVDIDNNKQEDVNIYNFFTQNILRIPHKIKIHFIN
jgi:hypothetical protein